MRWQTGRRSTNVEDRRGMPVGGGLKIGGVGILLALIIGWLTGANPLEILMLLSQQQPGAVSDQPAPAPTSGDPETDMVSAVLADTEDTWSEIFRSSGRQYEPPRLVLFSDAVQSACGMNSAAVGPFYC